MSAREEILGRIRAAISPEERGHVSPEARGEAIPRDYRGATDDGLDTFLDRLAHYEATVHVVAPADVAQTVKDIAGDRHIVVPPGLPDAWTQSLDRPLKDDPPLDPQTLDASDGVLTTCALAIAQTGTIVLDGGPGMGRRALTLLPDYHLCVVRADQLVGSVPEAIRALDHPTRPLTFISGPSATVDIEMVRVRGVHGPRRLEVVVAAPPPANPAP